MKIGIVADSTAYFRPEDKIKYNIETVPVNVLFEGKVYRDGIDLTASQAYQFLEKNPDDWATSAPAVGEFLVAFKKLAAQGAESIICLTLAQSISATWNNARNAKIAAEKEMPGVKIEVVDSGTAVIGETLLVLAIGRAAAEGRNLEELIELLEKLKKKIRVFILLETIRYVYRSGRVPQIASKIGSILPLKPILSVHGGRLHFGGATISKEKSREKILRILKEETDPNYPEVGLAYINTSEEAEKLKKEILSLMPSAKIFISEFSPIVGYATGLGTIGISFFVK